MSSGPLLRAVTADRTSRRPGPGMLVPLLTSSRRVLWLLVALGMLAGLLARRAGAQQPAQFRSRVELVQLQVSVADDAGGFFSGLRAEDFVVVVDGDPRPAQVAYEVDLRDKEPAATVAVDERDQPADSRPVASRRHYVLFFDFSFVDGRGVREARRAALEFIEQNLHPADLVAVASVNRLGIELRVPFTGDFGKVRESVAAIKLADVTDSFKLAEDMPMVAYEALVLQYVAQLERFGEMLQAIEGRKHLAMFSTGFADSVFVGGELDALSTQVGQRASGSTDGAGLVGRTFSWGSAEVRAGLTASVEALREADTVIHAVDPRGLREDGDGHQMLNYLAHETGGEAYWNMNSVTPALVQIEQSTARFYLIGYRKQASDAGTVELEVLVSRAGAKITSAPERLTPPPAYVEMNGVQRQLQLAEALADDSDVARIAAASQVVTFPGANGTARVVLFFEINGLELERLAAQRGADTIEFEIAGFAHADNNRLVDSFRRKVEVDVASMRTSGPMTEQSFRYADSVDVPPGKGRLRLLLREAVIGELTATTRRYVAPDDEGRLFLARPMIVDGEILPSLPEQERLADPLQFNNRRLAPIADPQVTAGETVDILVVAKNVQDDLAPDELLARISVQIGAATGGELYPLSDLRLLATHRVDFSAATQILLRVGIPRQITPGDKHLWVRLRQERTGDPQQQETRLYVRPQ